MKVSRKLIEQYIDLSAFSDEEIAHRLTFSGIEVEGYEKLANATNLVIGEVLTKVPVEGSDHLSLCSVNLGVKDGVKQIICGAPNVREKQKVIVAKVGAVLPEITIKETTIKGYQRSGMICALNELGVASEYITSNEDGIHVLSDESVVGSEDVLNYLGLDDTLFDIRPFANRSDILAVYNLVKELSGLFDVPYMLPIYTVERSFATNLKLKVKTPLVDSFTLTEVRNVVIEDSPLWLQNMLVKHGFRPINNIVDIGNYVMLLTGRPLHMYDLDKVADETFIVESDLSKAFVALDEETYNLEPGDQVISDKNEVLCLGGIIGALNSSVTPSSKRIALEVAHFDATAIRLAATRLNLPSEASSRFSKGVSSDNADEAINLALKLIADIIPEASFSNSVVVTKKTAKITPIKFDAKRINALLGTHFTAEEMIDALGRLGFSFEGNKVLPPLHRRDIDGVADLAEEVIRILGFEHVEGALPSLETTIGEYNERQKVRRDLRTLLRNRGLYETLNYTLVHSESLQKFAFLNTDEPLFLEHPMTPLRSHLRLNLLPSLLETLNYNVSRQQTNIALFEISDVMSKAGTSEHLAFVFYGKEALSGALKLREYDFYDGKGLVETILNYLNIVPSRVKYERIIKPQDDFHPAQSVFVKVDNKLVGVFGKLHPSSQKAFGLKEATIAGELDLKALLNVKTGNPKFTAPSRFPFVKRDLALVLDQGVEVGTLLNAVQKAGGKNVVNVEVFDVYTKLDNDPSKKSVALTITLLDSAKTLVDEDIKLTMDKIISDVVNKLKAEVRS